MLTHQPTEQVHDDHNRGESHPSMIVAVALITVLVSVPAAVAVVTVWLLVYANLTSWTQVMVCAAVPTAIGAGGLTVGRLLTRSGL